MSRAEVLFGNLAFGYEKAATVLFEGLTFHFPAGWTGVVGANGAGKTTILKLATGELTPDQGQVQAPTGAIYCPQRTDEPPVGLEELLEAFAGEAQAIKGRLGIEADWPGRWETLSHGERKRAQVGVALWRSPAVLAIDEPTNHIDGEARRLLAGALRAFRGVGLLVSHDRELLDALCRQCLFVDPPDAVMRPGGYSAGAEQADVEEETVRRQSELARQEADRLEREAVRRREEAARSDRRRSKRGLGKDNDARFKRNRARISGKDGVSGRLLRQLDGRLEQAQQQRAGIQVKKTYDLGIWLPEGRSQRDLLLSVPAGSLELGGERCLHFPALAVRPDARIAITGPNGGGKSTLIRYLVPRLNVEPEQVVYMPQEIGARESREILERVRQLSRDELGRMMTAVSRLGSRPERLLESAEPSPGEVRKLLLAMGIAHAPHIVIMDEPTNHLDLPSIECLEEALQGCPCGLLLVSHDVRFLERLTCTRWQVSAGDGGQRRDEMMLEVTEGWS